MTSRRPIQPDLKCSICGDLKRKPRVTRCDHSFCSECLERKLQASLNARRSPGSEFKFKCPGPECEREFILPDGSIENFSLNLDLDRLVESDKLRNKEPFCTKHSEICGLFCLDCKKEVCSQCLEDHDGHKCRNKSKAIQFYVEKCQEIETSAENKCKEIKAKDQTVDKFLSAEERKMESILETTLHLFQWTESKTRLEEVSGVSGILQELEFSGPSRKKMELVKKKMGYQFVNKIIHPIILNPGKSVMEPVLVLELAEQSFKRAEQINDIQDTHIKMKKSLSDSNKIVQNFLVSLHSSLNLENYSKSMVVSFQFEGIWLIYWRSCTEGKYSNVEIVNEE